ncbi:MAG: hypothetical protein WBD64_02470 [Candidatus Zixiibacteriota bacterium]
MISGKKTLGKRIGRAVRGRVWKATKGTAKGTVKGSGWAGKRVWERRKQIAKVVTVVSKHLVFIGIGAGKGVAETAYNTFSRILYTDKGISELKHTIKEQAREYNSIISEKDTLVDSGIIGGTLIADILTDKAEIPQEIEEAYQRAYPGLAEEYNFREALDQYEGPGELQGFLSGVKGKLFELKYVDELNSGKLPDGFQAFIADSPTQEGWDVGITGPNDELAEVFQLKATDSLWYVKKAMDAYPDIDIVTTSELESQILMHAAELGDVAPVVSGIANEELTTMLDSAHSSASDGIDMPDLKFPVIALALIAFSAYSKADDSIYRRSYSFGKRGFESMIAYGIGGIIAGVTNIWWLGLVAAIFTRYIAGDGRKKRLISKKLKKIVKSNERVIRKYKELG